MERMHFLGFGAVFLVLIGAFFATAAPLDSDKISDQNEAALRVHFADITGAVARGAPPVLICAYQGVVWKVPFPTKEQVQKLNGLGGFPILAKDGSTVLYTFQSGHSYHYLVNNWARFLMNRGVIDDGALGDKDNVKYLFKGSDFDEKWLDTWARLCFATRSLVTDENNVLAAPSSNRPLALKRVSTLATEDAFIEHVPKDYLDYARTVKGKIRFDQYKAELYEKLRNAYASYYDLAASHFRKAVDAVRTYVVKKVEQFQKEMEELQRKEAEELSQSDQRIRAAFISASEDINRVPFLSEADKVKKKKQLLAAAGILRGLVNDGTLIPADIIQMPMEDLKKRLFEIIAKDGFGTAATPDNKFIVQSAFSKTA